VTLTQEELRRLVRRDLVVAGCGSLVAIWSMALLLAAHLGFVSDLTAYRVVGGVAIVVALGSVYWWAAGPRTMQRDRYFVLIPLLLIAGPGIYAIHELGAGLIAVALSSAVGFFGAAVLGMALHRRAA
jgi:hypothetical protein